jgi:hypothetical protein
VICIPDHWFPGDPWDIDTLFNERPELLARKKESDQKYSLDLLTLKDKTRIKDWGVYSGTAYVGIDIGKRADPTALILMKSFEPIPPRPDSMNMYHISMVRRIELETPYPDIVRGIERLDRLMRKSGEYDEIVYVIDSGGVGESVIDALKETLPNANIRRVYITGGLKYRIDDWTSDIMLPKPILASTMIMLFEAERIYISTQDYAEEIKAMQDELFNYEMQISKAKVDQYGAFKFGKHDDLATALGLAAWYAEYTEGRGKVEIW